MFRTFVTAAALVLSVTAAQADTSSQLGARIHAAAEKACAPEAVPGLGPVAHYGAIFERCVDRVSNSTMTKYQAAARAKAVENDRLANK